MTQPAPTSAQPLRREFAATLRLALPLVFAELGWMFMGIVDTVMVGRLPNSAVAIGATGLGETLYNMLAIFAAGLLLGMDTFVSQAFGREDLKDARHTLINGLFLALFIAPVLMLLVLGCPPLMRRFGISLELVGPMTPFLRALNWGSLPLLGYFALRRYLQAVNVVRPITFAFISANVINFVGDWALIYGHLGMPAMGIVGSGWATCFSRVYLVAVLLITLLWTESKRKHASWQGAFRLELRRMIELLRLGIPAATQILFEIGALAVAATMCARMGPMALAGHEIALTCAALTFMVPLGISSAAAVRVGQEIGRGEPAAARRAGWSAIILGAGFMTCSALVFVTFAKTLAGIFSPDPQVIRIGSTLLLVAAAFQLFDGIQVCTTGVLRGTGDTRTPMLANLGAYWFIGLPLAFILGFKLHWGALGVWLGLCVGLILIGSGLLVVWHKRRLTHSKTTAGEPHRPSPKNSIQTLS
jgi:MATE family multidrug resistance protein